MKCLDTDILVAILRGNTDAKQTGIILDEEGGAYTTVISAYEILFGAKISENKKENIEDTKKLLSKLDIIDMNYDSAEKASDIHAKLHEEGKIIDARDIFIAAIALSRGCELITRNEKDFSRIKGLKIERW